MSNHDKREQSNAVVDTSAAVKASDLIELEESSAAFEFDFEPTLDSEFDRKADTHRESSMDDPLNVSVDTANTESMEGFDAYHDQVDGLDPYTGSDGQANGQEPSSARVASRFNWVTHGPIFGLVLVVIFYLLPTLMSSPTNESNLDPTVASSTPTNASASFAVAVPSLDGAIAEAAKAESKPSQAIGYNPVKRSELGSEKRQEQTVQDTQSASTSLSEVNPQQTNDEAVLASLDALKKSAFDSPEKRAVNTKPNESDYINQRQANAAQAKEIISAQVDQLEQARLERLAAQIRDLNNANADFVVESTEISARIADLEQAYQGVVASLTQLKKLRTELSQSTHDRNSFVQNTRYVLDYTNSQRTRKLTQSAQEAPKQRAQDTLQKITSSTPSPSLEFLKDVYLIASEAAFITLQGSNCERTYFSVGDLFYDLGRINKPTVQGVAIGEHYQIERGLHRHCQLGVQITQAVDEGLSNSEQPQQSSRAISPVLAVPPSIKREG